MGINGNEWLDFRASGHLCKICMYACMYVCMYLSACIPAYLSVCVRVSVFPYVPISARLGMYVGIHIRHVM